MDLIWDMVSLGGGSKYVLICTPKVWEMTLAVHICQVIQPPAQLATVCKRVSTCNHKYTPWKFQWVKSSFVFQNN